MIVQERRSAVAIVLAAITASASALATRRNAGRRQAAEAHPAAGPAPEERDPVHRRRHGARAGRDRTSGEGGSLVHRRHPLGSDRIAEHRLTRRRDRLGRGRHRARDRVRDEQRVALDDPNRARADLGRDRARARRRPRQGDRPVQHGRSSRRDRRSLRRPRHRPRRGRRGRPPDGRTGHRVPARRTRRRRRRAAREPAGRDLCRDVPSSTPTPRAPARGRVRADRRADDGLRDRSRGGRGGRQAPDHHRFHGGRDRRALGGPRWLLPDGRGRPDRLGRALPRRRMDGGRGPGVRRGDQGRLRLGEGSHRHPHPRDRRPRDAAASS